LNHRNSILAFIKLDILDTRPNLSLTNTSKLSDVEDERFAKVLKPLGRAILIRNKKLDLKETKMIYKIFYIHIEKNYFLGQEYSDKSINKPKPTTKRDIDKIESLARESFGKWLKVIYEALT